MNVPNKTNTVNISNMADPTQNITPKDGPDDGRVLVSSMTNISSKDGQVIRKRKTGDDEEQKYLRKQRKICKEEKNPGNEGCQNLQNLPHLPLLRICDFLELGDIGNLEQTDSSLENFVHQNFVQTLQLPIDGSMMENVAGRYILKLVSYGNTDILKKVQRGSTENSNSFVHLKNEEDSGYQFESLNLAKLKELTVVGLDANEQDQYLQGLTAILAKVEKGSIQKLEFSMSRSDKFIYLLKSLKQFPNLTELTIHQNQDAGNISLHNLETYMYHEYIIDQALKIQLKKFTLKEKGKQIGSLLWRGNLEISQADLPGFSYGDKIGVILYSYKQDQREVFDWNSGIKNVQLKRFPRKCLRNPNKLQPFLKESQMVYIKKDTSEEKWKNLQNQMEENGRQKYGYHLVAEGSDNEIYCPLILRAFRKFESNDQNQIPYDNTFSIGIAFCVDDPPPKENDNFKEIFQAFNEKLKHSLENFDVKHQPI